MRRDFTVSRTLDARPEVVWRALTEPELLAEWLMPNDFAPVVGHRFTMQADPGPGFDGRVSAEVLALEPPRRMVWSWRGGPIDTTVEFVLDPVEGDRTALTVHQRGFVGVRAWVVSAILQLGWRALLGRRLPSALQGT